MFKCAEMSMTRLRNGESTRKLAIWEVFRQVSPRQLILFIEKIEDVVSMAATVHLYFRSHINFFEGPQLNNIQTAVCYSVVWEGYCSPQIAQFLCAVEMYATWVGNNEGNIHLNHVFVGIFMEKWGAYPNTLLWTEFVEIMDGECISCRKNINEYLGQNSFYKGAIDFEN